MKHFSSSRYVAQELSPWITLPFATIGPLLAPNSPFDRSPIVVSHTCFPVRASKASRWASSVVTNTLSSYIAMPRMAAAAMRGIAMYDDKVFVTTDEAHLLAFDARTGKQVWETTIGDRSKGEFGASSGPIVAKGKVIQGLNSCATYREDEKCFISAYDAATGKLAWKFNTVARSNEAGGDSWGKLPDMFRAGTESWITGSYDPALNLTYWGTAQAKPWMAVSRGMSMDDDALYSSSTLALDVDTGKLAWHFQ